MQPVRWHCAMEGITKRLRQSSSEIVELISIKPSQDIDSLEQYWHDNLSASISVNHNLVSAVMDCPPRRARNTTSSKVAVVGMTCRCPGGADSVEKFWELLEQGRDVHTMVPPDRFNIATHVDPTGQTLNTSKTPFGCFVDEPGAFEPTFFGMSPCEAEQTDPMHSLALVTAYEALESAGYVHGRGTDARRIGTFYDQASDDYREVNSGQDIGTYFIPGGCRAFAPGRINFFCKFWGPSFSIDTACASGLAAVQMACSSLWSGDVDMAIAGGLNILTKSDVYAGLSRGHFLSSTGNCKTWDVGADGYCRSDGMYDSCGVRSMRQRRRLCYLRNPAHIIVQRF
jgi:acyl transferase domain-containing protein